MPDFNGYSFYRIENKKINFFFSNTNSQQVRDYGFSQQDAYDFMLSKYSGMIMRDLKISKFLSELGIKTVIDIGGDIGGLGVRLDEWGISSTIVDPNIEALEVARNNGLKVQAGDSHKIVKNPELFFEKNFDAIVCMNFTHANWFDQDHKHRFLSTLADAQPKAIVISWLGELPREFQNYIECQEFNRHKKVYGFLMWIRKFLLKLRLRSMVGHLDKVILPIEYLAIQRLLLRRPIDNNLIKQKLG